MIAGLTNHLWQSTLVAGLAWLVTLALRRDHARVRYGVWLAASLSSGTDSWTIAATVGRAAASVLSTPQVTGFVAVLVLVGGLAVYGLQRLLGAEEESSQ